MVSLGSPERADTLIRRHRSKKFHPGIQLSAAALTAVTLCGLVLLLRPRAPDIVVRDHIETGEEQQRVLMTGVPEDRKVYPMSVVPGGVYSDRELAWAQVRDPVVAEHYRGLNPSSMKRQVLEDPISRYVSFRRGNQIYWTRTPLRVPKGEMVLADSDSMVRVRCGNRLSDTPRDPTLPINERQPTEVDLDIAMPPELAAPVLAGLITQPVPGMPEPDLRPRQRAPGSAGQSQLAGLNLPPEISGTTGIAASGDPVDPGSAAGTDALGAGIADKGGGNTTGAGAPSAEGGRGDPTVAGSNSRAGPQQVASGKVLGGTGGSSLIGGTGANGLTPPSQNPALSGEGAVTPFNPDAMFPSPPQVSPGSLPAGGLNALSNPSQFVGAAFTPGQPQTASNLVVAATSIIGGTGGSSIIGGTGGASIIGGTGALQSGSLGGLLLSTLTAGLNPGGSVPTLIPGMPPSQLSGFFGGGGGGRGLPTSPLSPPVNPLTAGGGPPGSGNTGLTLPAGGGSGGGGTGGPGTGTTPIETSGNLNLGDQSGTEVPEPKWLFVSGVLVLLGTGKWWRRRKSLST